MMAWVALHDKRQDHNEKIRSFGARIRGQANVCQYNTACPNRSTTVDFTDCVLRDVLARGIADNEIQLDLLGDAKQDMTLEEMLKFVESKESGKRSASCLHDYSKGPQTAAASSYNYTAFGLSIAKPTTSVTFFAIADTGCQSCLAGISAIHRLGMTHKDLIPVALQMHAANNAKIAILRAAIIQFSGQSNSGKTLFTRQFIYITDSND